MPNYSREGKQEIPMSFSQFREGMETGHFLQPSHRAFAVLLFYYGVRKTEARRALKEQFSIQNGLLFFNVGQRLKHSKETDPLPIPVNAPYIDLLVRQIDRTPKLGRVFDFSDKTAYNIIARVWHYPHHFRLTRITGFFEDGRTITQVKNWTGLSLQALDYYAGKVDILNMGKSLVGKQ
jgi:integrase